MSKYAPLTAFLEGENADRISVTFDQIEKITGQSLPNSAQKYRAWWSNNPSNSVMTKAWLDAGYISKSVDLEKKKLDFCKVTSVRKVLPPPSSAPASPRADNSPSGLRRHPGFGSLKGTITIRMDFDLTAPADPDWAGANDEAQPR